MYSYTYDKTSGGLLLNSAYSVGVIPKEPRPVYAAELDLLGFNKFWKYDKQNDEPYMWAEANNYYYRGKKVATVKGGNLYDPPVIVIEKDENGNPVEPELNGMPLKKIDIKRMVERNRDLLSILETVTVVKIKNVFEKYQGKLDCYHVAFSGGKDSIVLLDLVKKTLPVHSYIVCFADTGMEFPDTYDLIEKVKKECKEKSISFFTSSSKFKPLESWKLIAPPSRTIRWCCSIHKSTPQTLLLREITQKKDYKGLVYVGVRRAESSIRSEYVYETPNAKQFGQIAFYPILEWTSAEVWLYIYANKLPINLAYKKGLARVGCICCPMGGGRASYMEWIAYKEEKDKYLSIIANSNSRTEFTTKAYLMNGGWNARKDGRFLTNNQRVYEEIVSPKSIQIVVSRFKTPWTQWIKPLGDLVEKGNLYTIKFREQEYCFQVRENSPGMGYTIEWEEGTSKDSKLFYKYLRYVFRKAAYCEGCQTCEVNCPYGCISFKTGFQIQNCKHCLSCLKIDSGCLVYKSLTFRPSKGGTMTGSISLNSFSNHTPKTEWLKGFFKEEDYLADNSLGGPQLSFYKRFLSGAGLIEGKNRTPLVDICNKIGWDSSASLGILLINLAAQIPQINWYIRNMVIDHEYAKKELEDKLQKAGQSKANIDSIIPALKRFADNPFGTELHWCAVYKEGKDSFYTRTKCVMTDYRVFLYGLYKFAELNDDLKHFTLDTLMDESADRKGLSPTQIFGIDAEEAELILKGLSARYEDFINASFTHDLQKIDLREDKTSADVLSLF